MPLIRTKLQRPPIVGDHVHRSRLLERLDQRRQRPLTLVTAPAGSLLTNLATIDSDQVPPTTVEDLTEVTTALPVLIDPVPALSLWGLVGLSGLLLAVGFAGVRRFGCD